MTNPKFSDCHWATCFCAMSALANGATVSQIADGSGAKFIVPGEPAALASLMLDADMLDILMANTALDQGGFGGLLDTAGIFKAFNRVQSRLAEQQLQAQLSDTPIGATNEPGGLLTLMGLTADGAVPDNNRTVSEDDWTDQIDARRAHDLFMGKLPDSKRVIEQVP